NGNGTFLNEPNVTVDVNPRSVTLGDFNGDGRLDFAAANYGTANVSIALGNGDGTFRTPQTFPAGTGPFSIATGDVNGDGILVLDPVPWDYDPTTPLGKPLGTPQCAVCYLAVELAKRRHQVILLNSTKRPREVLGVDCRSVQQFATAALAEPLDALVVVNGQ